MDAYDWFGAALALSGWALVLWLVGWNPKRLLHFVESAVVVGLNHAASEPVDQGHKARLDDVMRYMNARAARMPGVERLSR